MHVAADAGNNGGGAGGIIDGMATEQGLYATVAYRRFLDGETFLYDMSDVAISAGTKPVVSPTIDTGSNSGEILLQRQQKRQKQNRQLLK